MFGYDASGTEVSNVDLGQEVTAITADQESGAMWVGFPDGTVATLDAEAGTSGPPVKVGDGYVNGLALAEGALWAVLQDGPLVRLDPETLEVVSTVPLPGAAGNSDLAIG